MSFLFYDRPRPAVSRARAGRSWRRCQNPFLRPNLAAAGRLWNRSC